MLNKVILMGRLCADPDFRQTPSGVSVCRIRVAVNRPFVNKASGEREADFISVTCWRNTAEFVSRYFHKGSMIIVEGSLRNSDYTDQNGVKHYSMDVQADNVSFGESKSAAASNQQGGYPTQNPYPQNGGYQAAYQQPAPAPSAPAPAPAAAKPAPVMELSRLRCIFCRMSMCHVKSARENGIIGRLWK